MIKKLRVCTYTRVSTKKKAQISSLEFQRLSIKQYIEEHNYELVLEYEDIGSGLTENRKNFKLMIKALENNEFDILIVKSVCRISRNTTIAAFVKSLLQKHGVALITIDKGINTLTNPKSIHELVSMTQSYENESLNTSDRIKGTKRSKAKSGQFNGSIAPYGYILEKGKLKINTDESPSVVKRIYSEFISGKNYAQIAKILGNENIKTPSLSSKCSQNISLKWGYSTIRGILTNEVYCGHLVQNKSTLNYITDKDRTYLSFEDQIKVKNTHEAIICEEDFLIVQSKINTKKESKPRNSTHLYSDILFCGDCGSKMHIRRDSKGEKYYVCGSSNKGTEKKCTNHKIFKTKLSKFILEDIKVMVSTANFKTIFDYISSYVTDYFESLQYKRDLINPKTEALNRKKRIAYTDKCNGDISLDDYKLFSDEFNKQIHTLQVEAHELDYILKNKDYHINELICRLNEEKNNFLSTERLTPDILHRFVRKIEIFNDESLNIDYIFSPRGI